MADELSYDAIEVGKTYGPWKYPLADRIARYLEAIENEHPWHRERSPWGPAVAPPSVLGLAAMRFLDSVGPVPPGTLHAKQEIETSAALRLDRQPAAYGKFIDKYEKRGRKYFVFEARFRDETGLIIGHSRVTMVFPPEEAAEGSGSRAEQKTPERKGELGPITRTLTQEKLTAYSEDSANAERGQSIHVNPEVAKAVGFPTTVAQGLMAADYMSELMTVALGKEWYEYAGLSVAFVRPMLCGDTITANGRVSEELEEGAVVRKVYELWTENERGEPVALGRSHSLIMPGRETAPSPRPTTG
ncbi:MAG: MaoC family dehydratase [Dehalococcoidia bacterium]